MRLEKYLQRIQCGGSSFSLDILHFLIPCMFIWHIPVTRAFRRDPLIARVMHLSYTHRIQGGVPPRIILHGFPVYETLIGSPFNNLFPFLGIVNCPGWSPKPNTWFWALTPTRAKFYTNRIYYYSI